MSKLLMARTFNPPLNTLVVPQVLKNPNNSSIENTLESSNLSFHIDPELQETDHITIRNHTSTPKLLRKTKYNEDFRY